MAGGRDSTRTAGFLGEEEKRQIRPPPYSGKREKKAWALISMGVEKGVNP